MADQDLDTQEPKNCCKFLFFGRVQGVGFRQSVRYLARSHPVGGRVKNLRDGSVELLAEGTPIAIQGLILDIQRQFGNQITRMEKEDFSLHGFGDFRIDY